ncbi:endonuclease domain-containing protein [Microbacterium dauci]|uniref:DUF559 domain-containing protein n=1 Tax=Microbacterium dauci TaxID=3048008 RepID=A0ABT6ZEE1_9MICO|nr:DUF559 domain-containing protein [Microbacterium sp. LX3-4]MDJ1114532.1 DUF559 domain-containing protein [Microbacterium sp. LX3-4]
MPRRPAPLPPGLPAPFACAEALDAGVQPRRLRARDLTAPYRGMRAPVAAAAASPDGAYPIDEARRADAWRRARQYACVIEPHAFFCGATAAALFGHPIRDLDVLDVAVHAPERAPRRRGIRGRKVLPTLADVIELDGLSVAAPATTWAMLGSELDIQQLVRLGDAFVRIPRDSRGRPLPDAQLTTIEALGCAVDAGRRAGAPKLRAALGLIRVGAMSPLETDLRLVLVDAHLPEPELDVEIRDRRGRLVAIADCAYPERRIVIEAEGDHHRADATQWSRDIERAAALTALGWDVVRATSAHIRGRGRRAVRMVRAALARRA